MSRFSEQSLFAYEAEPFGVPDLATLLAVPKMDSEAYKMGGLADFSEVFMILREYYSNYPILDFRELRTNTGDNPVEVDDLWHEPVGLKLMFNRLLKLRAKVAQQSQRQKHGKEGLEKTYDLQIFLGLPVLFDADYFPRNGDEFTWRGVVHSITHVHVQPTDYFQMTSLPLHITVDSVVKQHDGTVPHQDDRAALIGNLEESGRPTYQAPVEVTYPPLTKAPDDGF